MQVVIRRAGGGRDSAWLTRSQIMVVCWSPDHTLSSTGLHCFPWFRTCFLSFQSDLILPDSAGAPPAALHVMPVSADGRQNWVLPVGAETGPNAGFCVHAI